MKNPLMSRLLGESDDVVPVIANRSSASFRSRRAQTRQPNRRGDRADDNDDDAVDNSVQRMVGEAHSKDDDSIIPSDAEDVSPYEMTVGKPLREPKEIVQEPSHPTGEKEKYQTPYSALTAPDVTPQSTEPIDPSEVPGSAGPEKFTVSDLERAEPAEGGEDVVVKAMDVLLGRTRAAKPATQPGEFEQAGAITTEAHAAAALGIQTPLYEEAQSRAANMLVPAKDGGSGMPAPTATGDGAAVYSAFRRFAG